MLVESTTESIVVKFCEDRQPCGYPDYLKLDKVYERFLRLLLDLYDDGSFMTDFWDKRVVISIMNYREHVVSKIPCLTQSEFIQSYLCNKKDALQRLFVFPVYNHHIVMLEEQLENKTMTLSDLYEQHMREPNINMVKLIKLFDT